jgi:hypothetical protein
MYVRKPVNFDEYISVAGKVAELLSAVDANPA